MSEDRNITQVTYRHPGYPIDSALLEDVHETYGSHGYRIAGAEVDVEGSMTGKIFVLSRDRVLEQYPMKFDKDGKLVEDHCSRQIQIKKARRS